jgi:hypothetical protein
MMGLAAPQTWGLALLLWLATVAGGYWAGDHNRNNAWLATQAVQQRAANKALQDEAARSQAAQQKYITSSTALQNSYATLESKFNELTLRGPIVVFRDRRGGINAVGGLAGPVATGASDQAAVLPAGAGLAGTADAAVGLSLGAVWMWNSALLGSDTAAGACSAADTASAACAVDSGLGLADAWANHFENARSCAADRLRQQQLIDFVNARPTP